MDLKVSSVTDLGAYSFELTYDPAVVTFVSVTNGSFLGSTGRSITCAGPAVTATSVIFGCNSSGGAGRPGRVWNACYGCVRCCRGGNI